MKPKILPFAAFAAFAALGCAPLNAASVAFDSASSAAYNDGWDNGDNGGSGWGGGWVLSGVSGFSGQYLASSTSNGNGDGNSDGDIDTAGRSWFQYAHTGNTAGAVRPFSGSLSVGQTFSIAFDNGFIQNGGTVGFGLQNASGNNVFEYYFSGGSSNYTVSSQSYSGTTSGFSDEGLVLAFTLTASNTYSLAIQYLNPANNFGGTGTLFNPGGGQAITQVRIFNFNAGNDGANNNAAVNSISIVPEPATALLGSLGLLALLRRRK